MSRPAFAVPSRLSPRAGVGLELAHARDVIAEKADVGFFEIHAENYMGAGGPPLRLLEAIRRDHALSIHGVGLSIGRPGPLDRDHLARLALLVARFEPEAVSEHLAWSSHGTHLADLLPLPLTPETLDIVAAHVDEVQTALGRAILLENPATYVRFAESTIGEVDFLAEVSCRTGCGLLLDVANVDVSATNHGFDPRIYLAAFPLERVGEIHLAGRFETVDADGLPLLIDAHDGPVPESVWALYAEVIARAGPLPTLIEWNNDLPTFARLVAEARTAEAIMVEVAEGGRTHACG